MASYIQHLEDLKEKYQVGTVSLLIGTGFSKNAYKDMPLWDDLLLEMAQSQYSSKTDVELKEIIKQDPTAIVETYLDCHRRSMLEAYIEQHIPFVDKDLRLWFAPKKGYEPVQKGTLNDDDLILHYQLLKGNWPYVYTTNYDNLLELAAARRGTDYIVVTNSNEFIGTINKRSIIKLHGNIKDPHCDALTTSFDREEDIRYIISRSDYNQYFSHHQSFCNSIEMSLLQGAFCLIGFSGSDPNFTNWSRWLKNNIDVSQLNQASQKIPKPSIYLIDMNKDELDHGELIYLQNHYIHVIRLTDPLVKERIGFKGEGTDLKSILSHFLDYLYETDKQQQEYYLRPMSYRDLWMKSLTWGKPKAEVNYGVLNDILAKKKENRIIQDSYWQEQLLDRIYTKDAYTPQDIDYIFCALQDTLFLPGQYQGMNKRLATAELTPQQQYIYQQMNHREETLFNPAKDIIASNDAATYEKILRSLFILEFDKATALLNEWAPSGLYTIKKALFMCLLGLKPNINQVESEKRLQTDQEALWISNILNGIHFQQPLKYDTAQYEAKGLNSIYDVTNSFMKACLNEKYPVEPHGVSKDKIIWIGKSDVEYRRSFRFIQFMIEMPMLPQLGIISFINSGKWYNVFKDIFQRVPYPSLFYSLLCNGKKVLKRIGQDIAYSQRLYNEGKTEEMLSRMLSALLQNHITHQIAEGIFNVCSELFVAVKPDKWQGLYYQIWKKYVCADLSILEKPNGIADFIHNGARYLSNESIICSIVRDTLARTKEKKEISFAIDMLYYLRKMQIDSTDLENDVNHFIDNIQDPKEFVVITNIHYYLSDNQAKRVSQKILQMISGNQLPTITLRPLCYYAKYAPRILSEVKTCIVHSQHLWDNGIRGNYATDSDLIKLSRFKSILTWTNEELLVIYNRMKDSFNQMENSSFYKKKEGFFFLSNFDELLNEMYDFLISNSSSLSHIDDYKQVKKMVKNELNNTRGFKHIETAIASDDKATFGWGLKEMLKAYKLGYIKNAEKLLILTLDRVILKKAESFKSSLDFLSYILKHFYSANTLPEDVKQKFIQILATYSEDQLLELDQEIPFVTPYFAFIAHTLKNMGIKSKSINKWVSYIIDCRYNIHWEDYLDN